MKTRQICAWLGYEGSQLGDKVQRFKYDMVGPVAARCLQLFYFLPGDPREKMPLMAQAIHLKRPFNRMRLRHDLWKKKYPDSHEVYGIPWTGIANASQQVQDLARPQMDLSKLPFDPLEYIEHLDQIPFDRDRDPSLGN
jgi:hypothetical protein